MLPGQGGGSGLVSVSYGHVFFVFVVLLVELTPNLSVFGGQQTAALMR